ncbi:MAG: winged helix-turn-helix domain-containing protein, partial [Oscillospiraceae bacterium]
ILMKRVEALLRRNNEAVSSAKNYWGLLIDESSRSVKIDGEDIPLTLKEFDILAKIIAHIDRVYSREQLLDDVWGMDFYGDTRT